LRSRRSRALWPASVMRQRRQRHAVLHLRPQRLFPGYREPPSKNASMPQLGLTSEPAVWFTKWKPRRHARSIRTLADAPLATIIKIPRHELAYSVMSALDERGGGCEHVRYIAI
jgi:hypothetical protein